MLGIALTAGLALLVVGGLLELSREGLTDPTQDALGARTRAAFTPADYRDPGRILAEGRKLGNAFVLVLEATLLVVALSLTVAVAVQPGVAASLKAALAATLVVGGVLVGQGMYARLGLGRESPETVADYRDSLAEAFGPEVAGEYAAVHDAVTTARGETALDEVTVGLLAAARYGEDLSAVARWSERVDLAVAQRVEDRAGELADAGVVELGGDGLRVTDRFADATGEQLATVAASVLD